MKKGLVFWFTGLSGSGKTTVAGAAKELLAKNGLDVHILDGDEIRKNYPQPLGFSEADIKKNNQLIAEHCLATRARYDAVFVPIISPYAESRAMARRLLAPGFYEIYFSASLECVVARDTKGLYQKAKRNEIPDMIGFSKSSPYEAPARPDLTISTEGAAVAVSAGALASFVLGLTAR